MSGSRGVNVAHQQTPSVDVNHDQLIQRSPVESGQAWNSRTVPLGEVLCGRTTPVVLRDAARPDDLPCRDVYVHSVVTCGMVVVEGLAADRRSGLVSTGRRYLVPVDHRGWYELLSQDGHAATPITTVQQLMKQAPERCLVRRTIVGLAADGTRRSACKISAGETVSLDGVVTNPTTRSQCVKCKLDSTGQGVLLSDDQRGLFSPVAGPTNVAGVHRMRSVVAKFRLPVIVRLIGRKTPPTSEASGSAAFRVIAMKTEHVALAVPLWLVGGPADVSRRSLLSLPTAARQVHFWTELRPPRKVQRHPRTGLTRTGTNLDVDVTT